jgi:hypothetical protein
MSLAVQNLLAELAGDVAESLNLQPRVFTDRELYTIKLAVTTGDSVRVPIPDFGDYRPIGWLCTAWWLYEIEGEVDAVLPSQPQSPRQIVMKLAPGFGYAILEVGNSCANIGQFERYRLPPPPGRRTRKDDREAARIYGYSQDTE